MIARLSGIVERIDGHTVTLDASAPGGPSLAYEVLTPAYLAERLAAQTGKPFTFITLQYLESQNQGASFTPRLIGFASAADSKFFELFTTVKGIGNRKALRAMALEPARIAHAIASRDVPALKELPEIGKRLAETIIAELHGKIDAYLSPADAAGLDAAIKPFPSGAGAAEREAVDVLIALGEPRDQAERRVALAAATAAQRGRKEPTPSDLVDIVFGKR